MRILRLLGIGLIWWLMPGADAVAHQETPQQVPHAMHIKMALEMERIHVFFTGKVQGVGFRQSAKDFANALSIKGWVRNLEDSRVELVAEGNDDDLQLLIGKLRREFQIEKIEMRRERADGRFKGFDIVD